MITVNFTGYAWSVHARLLWQALFNIYRKNNCPLDNMDNILIDLKYCKEVVDKTIDGEVKFMWSVSPGYHHTTWYWGHDALAYAKSVDEIIIVGTVNEKAATLQIVKGVS